MKIRLLIFSVFLLSISPIFSKAQFNSYNFIGDYLEELLPLSKEHIKAIHENGYLRCEVKGDYCDKITYDFDSLGFLISEKRTSKDKNYKVHIYYRANYVYNQRGQLVSKRTIIDNDISLDTFVYLENGKICFFQSIEYCVDCRKRNQYYDAWLDWEFHSSSSEGSVLIDDNQLMYYFDRENRLVKIQDSCETFDSISFIKRGDGYTMKTYWQWNEKDTRYDKRKEFQYLNGIIQKSFLFRKYAGTIVEENIYVYNENGQLISIRDDHTSSGHFFFYNSSGLLVQRILYCTAYSSVFNFRYYRTVK